MLLAAMTGVNAFAGIRGSANDYLNQINYHHQILLNMVNGSKAPVRNRYASSRMARYHAHHLTLNDYQAISQNQTNHAIQVSQNRAQADHSAGLTKLPVGFGENVTPHRPQVFHDFAMSNGRLPVPHQQIARPNMPTTRPNN